MLEILHISSLIVGIINCRTNFSHILFKFYFSILFDKGVIDCVFLQGDARSFTSKQLCFSDNLQVKIKS